MTELSADDEALVSLIALCAIKDQQALKKLYDRTAPFLNGVAYRLLNSKELSNEVLQDAFVQIWQNAAVYRVDKAKPMTWMTSIVRYRALDKIQSEKRHHQKRDDNEDAVNELADTQTPEQDYDQQQTRAQIMSCLAQMNDKVKRSIELAYLQGYSREEIAEDLNTKVNTVKSWLHRGSERLKQCLRSTQRTLA